MKTFQYDVDIVATNDLPTEYLSGNGYKKAFKFRRMGRSLPS